MRTGLTAGGKDKLLLDDLSEAVKGYSDTARSEMPIVKRLD
jgi:hypothetical protein